MKPLHDEEGFASIWVCFLCVVCMIAIFGATELGRAQIVKAKTQNAADASALSAAYEIANNNKSQSCKAARKTARENNAVIKECKVSDKDVYIKAVDKEDLVVTTAKAKID